jgi:quercetin dioxygenase-like cupin family protein
MRIDVAEKARTYVLVTLICLTGTLCDGQKKQADVAASPNAPQAMTTLYEDLKWQAIVPELGEDSPQIAILRVDPATKATQLLIRTPKKVHVPMHWHTANETHTIIQGTATFEHDGKLQLMTPGSFNYMPAHMQHQAWASEGAVIFITVDGAWDVNWVGNPPGKSDLNREPHIPQ